MINKSISALHRACSKINQLTIVIKNVHKNVNIYIEKCENGKTIDFMKLTICISSNDLDNTRENLANLQKLF